VRLIHIFIHGPTFRLRSLLVTASTAAAADTAATAATAAAALHTPFESSLDDPSNKGKSSGSKVDAEEGCHGQENAALHGE